MKPQLTGKALVAAGHLLAKQVGPNTPLKDISALISSLATHLDVALVRGDLLQHQVEQIPGAFYSIGEQLRNQDNRCTDQPIFVVFEKREVIGSDEHSPSRIVWTQCGEEADDLRSKRLELLHQDGRETRGYDRYAMQEIDIFVTACFTEQGCKDYLRINGHNLRQPFIFAAGSYRNHEYQTIRSWLTGLCTQTTPEQQQGAA